MESLSRLIRREWLPLCVSICLISTYPCPPSRRWQLRLRVSFTVNHEEGEQQKVAVTIFLYSIYVVRYRWAGGTRRARLATRFSESLSDCARLFTFERATLKCQRRNSFIFVVVILFKSLSSSWLSLGWKRKMENIQRRRRLLFDLLLLLKLRFLQITGSAGRYSTHKVSHARIAISS
jgi:K+-sensing histidine kinase KdpD